MKKESSYRDYSPRAERINRLTRRLDRVSQTLKETKYESPSLMLEDLAMFQSTEKEIEIQKAYLTLEEKHWYGTL